MLTRIVCVLALFVPAAAWAQEPKKEPAEPKTKTEKPFEMVVQGQILPEDARDPFTGQPSKVHAVRLSKDKAFVAELSNKDGFNGYVRVHESVGNQVAQNFRNFGGQNHTRFTAPKDDVYLIHVGGNGNNGIYTLTLKDYIPTPMKLVALPAFAEKKTEIKSNLDANDARTELRNDYPAKFYSVEFKKDKTYQIDMISPDNGRWDTYLFLLDANGLLLSQDDDSGGNLQARIRWTARADARFRIVATTYNGNLGAYTLRVTEEGQ